GKKSKQLTVNRHEIRQGNMSRLCNLHHNMAIPITIVPPRLPPHLDSRTRNQSDPLRRMRHDSKRGGRAAVTVALVALVAIGSMLFGAAEGCDAGVQQGCSE